MLLFNFSTLLNPGRWRVTVAAFVLILWTSAATAYEESPVYWQENGTVTVEEAAPPQTGTPTPAQPDWNAEPHWEGAPAPPAGRKRATQSRAVHKKKSGKKPQGAKATPAGEKVLVPYGEKSTPTKGKQPPTLPLPKTASASQPAAAVSPSESPKPSFWYALWDSLLAPDKKLMMVGLAFTLVLLLFLLDQHKKSRQVKKDKQAPAPHPAAAASSPATPAAEAPANPNCPVCGADNLATALFCEQCGAKLHTPDPMPHLVHLPDAPPAPPPAAEPKGFCPVCGAASHDGATFCEECGASLDTFETDLPDETALLPPPVVEAAPLTESTPPPVMEETEENTPPPPLTEQNDPFHGMSQAALPDASVFLGEDDPTGLGLGAATAGAPEPQAGEVDFDRFQGEVATLFEDTADTETGEAPANPDAPTGDIAALLPEQDTLPHEEAVTLNVDDLPVQPPPSYLAEMGDPYQVQDQLQAAADAQAMTENLALPEEWPAEESPAAPEETAQEAEAIEAEAILEPTGELVACPLCGESNPTGSDHCFNCGAGLV